MRIPCAAAIYALLVVVGMGLRICPGAAQSDAEVDALNRRAAELYQAKNFEEAMAAAQQALALAEARFAANDPRLSKLLSNLALINEVLNRAAEAEPLYRRALAIDEAASGPDHIAVGRTLSRLAQFCARQKRYAEAEGFYQRSVSLWIKAANSAGELLRNAGMPICSSLLAKAPSL